MTSSAKTFTLITGASGGFGAEFARLCAAEGRNLILVARSSGKLERLASEIGSDVAVRVIAQDLSEPDAAQKVYQQIRRQRLIIDQLINNAGSGDFAPLAKANPVRQERMLALNVTSLTMLTTLLLPAMIQRGQGRIMNVGSTASFVPVPFLSVYGASKSYVLSFSEALSAELRGTGVTVTCLCPGPSKTGFSRSARLSTSHPIARGRTSAASVASFGYRAMLDGIPLAIPGIKNQLFVTFTKFLPRAIVRRMMVAYSSRV
ncbi:MAG TPA: SDR family oxidoreductase [Candidatus Saccharimonadales bacterium]|nr:SDR family oxidoreductase [Candidatus Saccharimonadales bacterium]